MNCPALASPGGDSGVRTPIFTGFWARAGAANPHATIATSTAAALVGHVRPLIDSLRRSPRSLSTPMPSEVSAHVCALLRVGASVMLPSTAPREAAGIEEREVEGGLAVQEPLGDIPAGGGRVLEAVAAEADGEEEALDARRPADDRVVVGRQRPEARPAAGDPRVLHERQTGERRHLHALEDLDAELARSARERVRHLGGPCHGVLGPPDPRDQVVHAEGGDELLRVCGRDDADVRAQRSLERDPLLEPAEVPLLGEEIEVADRRVARVDAELFLEALEDLDALEREADLGLGRELNADATRRLAGRPRADGLALEDDDVAESTAGQVVGDRAADHAAADDDRARRPGRVHEAGLYMPSPMTPMCRGMPAAILSRRVLWQILGSWPIFVSRAQDGAPTPGTGGPSCSTTGPTAWCTASTGCRRRSGRRSASRSAAAAARADSPTARGSRPVTGSASSTSTTPASPPST